MQEQFSVQVKESQVRDKPSFLAVVVATIKYGDQVSVLQTQDSWAEVTIAGKAGGWVHLSALTKKKIIRDNAGTQADLTTSNAELALAGKGFNKQIEEQFRRQNSQANFAAVDRMEKYRVSQQEMEQFLKDGGLSPQGGAV